MLKMGLQRELGREEGEGKEKERRSIISYCYFLLLLFIYSIIISYYYHLFIQFLFLIIIIYLFNYYFLLLLLIIIRGEGLRCDHRGQKHALQHTPPCPYDQQKH